MGVHDTDKYAEIKSLLGIPADEPIFILRGQDKAASETIDDYLLNAEDEGADEEFLSGVEKCRTEFEHFKTQNLDRMKVPD